MKIAKIALLTAATLTVTLFTSCENDDTISTSSVVAPVTYSFERNSQNTVHFSGQTTRIKMGDEIDAALLNPVLSESDIASMYSHQAGDNNFSDAALNAADKNMRSKTAASRDFFSANSTDAAAIKADFDGFIAGQVNEIFPAWNNIASSGVAGQLQEAGGGAIRYMDGRGLEYNQAFVKGAIGALMLDQINNNYLSPEVLDEASNRADNDMEVLATGANYTAMEHKWDEAFGYLYGAEADIENPVLRVDQYLNKYLARVEDDADFTGIANEIYDAFKLGRAAIVAKDYDLRDRQAAIIQERLSDIMGIRAVYYLQQAKSTLSNDQATAFHDLSEGYGFIYSLQFTRKPGTSQPYFSKSEVDAYLAELMVGNGFWDVTPATLDRMSDEISARFTFTTAQAGS
ncbi:DUF4856 domain-containing protein [uncultured Nonlabens sp.]|uniref:DUF4856 domain-containing protein n=1 Tax=uncultured Nonlabens sp. TaxID=859306 RepID=UPI0030D87290|tara:strand:+ start:22298 stop:23503 length:1206 start_codon:yes stop_codon:yes gene_type:complete